MSEEHTHTHVAPDGTVYEHIHTHEHEEQGHDHHEQGHTHEHEHSHAHGHTHTHANTKAVLNRLSRAIGHLESIRRMVEEGRDCSEVLIQLSAVKSAINNTGKVILKEHIGNTVKRIFHPSLELLKIIPIPSVVISEQFRRICPLMCLNRN